jgi:hypothetical protein
MIHLALLLPQYNQLEYTEAALLSAACSTALPNGGKLAVLVLDDGTPGFVSRADARRRDWQRSVDAVAASGPGSVLVETYAQGDNCGLTHQWNKGLREAQRLGAKYVCAANNDLLFARHWNLTLEVGLRRGFGLTGPLTNAPGTEQAQAVTEYLPDYRVCDQQDWIDRVGAELYESYGADIRAVEALNGFCLYAEGKTWAENAFDANHVFRPRNDFNSKGRPNPTPLMTLNEYELQKRWRERGLLSGLCLGSFVFHYRSVTRGDRHKSGLWHRRQVRA